MDSVQSLKSRINKMTEEQKANFNLGCSRVDVAMSADDGSDTDIDLGQEKLIKSTSGSFKSLFGSKDDLDDVASVDDKKSVCPSASASEHEADDETERECERKSPSFSPKKISLIITMTIEEKEKAEFLIRSVLMEPNTMSLKGVGTVANELIQKVIKMLEKEGLDPLTGKESRMIQEAKGGPPEVVSPIPVSQDVAKNNNNIQAEHVDEAASARDIERWFAKSASIKDEPPRDTEPAPLRRAKSPPASRADPVRETPADQEDDDDESEDDEESDQVDERCLIFKRRVGKKKVKVPLEDLGFKVSKNPIPLIIQRALTEMKRYERYNFIWKTCDIKNVSLQ